MSKLFYKNIEDELTILGFQIVDSNLEKPWGAYFCINEQQVQDFSDKFFSFIEHVYCIPGVWKHTEDKHIKAIEARFTGNDEFAKYHGNKEL